MHPEDHDLQVILPWDGGGRTTARLWDHLLGIPVRSLSALEVVLLLIASMHTTCGTRGGNLHLLKTISGAV